MSDIDVTGFVLDLEKNDEGFRSGVYKDSQGYWTIGIGTLVDPAKGGGITHDEAVYLAGNRVRLKMAELDAKLPWWRGQPAVVQFALLNMAFQMGSDGLVTFRTTLSLIQQGKYAQAADNALQSLWAKQTPNRAKRVTDLIRSAQHG